MPEYTGRHLDGFGNRVTCWAAANPSKELNGGNKLTTRAAGFGVVRFNKKIREITFECWPRNVDIHAPKARQYPGWPKTIKQADNYNRRGIAYLPALNIKGQTNPVIQVIDESNNEIVYTIRINGTSYRPKVFREGSYSIKVGEGEVLKTLRGVKSIGVEQDKTIEVNLE